MKTTTLFAVLLLLVSPQVMAQTRLVTGTVTDKGDNVPIPGVSIVAKNTGTGTTTDAEGRFSLQVPMSVTTLVVSSVGYESREVAIPESNTVSVALESSASELGEVVVTIGRGSQRTITDTPLPVDVLTSRDLTSTGQLTIDKALQYRVPSFNTVQTPVNDATSLLDPYEIRNMGPSRTLILINGKRKNASALIYTQTSPGRGETGVDISAIPVDAIKGIEVLRDGASAQYGSDAIAGVMNVILKDDAEQGSVTLRTGITKEGDGESFGISVNNGLKLPGSGFINYTVDFSKVALANRPGTVDAGTAASQLGPDNRPLAGGEYADFVYVDPDDPENYAGGIITTPERNDILAANAAGIQSINNFLADKPDAGNINGSPETTAAKFLVNGSFGITDHSNVYFNAAYIYKKVNSFANYRTPYWRSLSDYPYMADLFGDGTAASYKGYAPTFDGDLSDYNATLGFKSEKGGWNTDISLTVGGNRQTYTVRNSHNRNTSGLRNPDTYLGDIDGDGVVDVTPHDADGNGTIGPNEGVELIQGDLKYLANSPVTFRAGGSQFNHMVGNIDIMKSLYKGVTFSLGSEFRSETFEIIEGDLASYEAGGADSFAGNSKENSFSSNRYNLGGYVTFGFDFTEDFLVDVTGRFENYSDFGDAFVYKLSTRYKFLDDNITLRGSLSSGFRAPSLHQIYTQKAQYSFVPGKGIQVSGLVNNVSREANLMNLEKLDAEKSTNITLGVGIRPTANLSFTLDYYNINVEDRIVLSNELDPSDVIPELVAVSFFSNAIDTETSGLDLVGTYGNIGVGRGSMHVNLAANVQLKNAIVGDIRNPAFAETTGQEVIDATQKALLFTSRPKYKGIVGIDYTLNKFFFTLNNTMFGPTNFRNAGMDSGLEIEFKTKVVTDLNITYQVTNKTKVTLNVNNLLDVLPEWKFKALNAGGESILADENATQAQSNLITFNQRYPIVTYDGSHFSQLGTMFNLAMNIQL